MEKKIEIIIRTFLIIAGLLLMIYGGYEIYTTLESQGIITDITNNTFEYDKYDFTNILSLITIIIVGYILFTIGTSWKNILKTIGTICISFAVLFLTLAMTLYPIHSNSEEITNSIQPTIDYILAGSIDKILLSQINISEGKTINLVYNNKTTPTTIGKIDEKNANLIWKELGFDEKVSYETKNITINILLTVTINEVGEETLKTIPLPLNMVGQFLQNSNETKDIKKIINYDLFNKNITLRAENLKKLRTDCETKKITLEQLCTPILMTKYDEIMKNASNIQNDQIPSEFLTILKDINTEAKMQSYIEEKTSIWISFTLIALMFFIIGSVSYYMHFKVFKIEHIELETAYIVSKINFINYLPAYIIFILGYFLVTGKEWIVAISQTIPQDMFFIIELIITSPIFLVFMNILKEMMIIMTIYLFLSLILFIVFYFILKKKKKEENTE